LRARIHRGAHEIGGNCIELQSAGQRLVLDLGRPLTAGANEEVSLPAIDGLDRGDPALLGVLLSHPHQDHCGLLPRVPARVPVYLGAAAQRILAEAAFFTRAGLTLTPAGALRHRQTFDLGPFRVTPYLNDHSAYDAYSLLVEAGGRRLFYTGDIRGHGRKAALFEALLRDPPRGIDALLMDGTHVGPRQPAEARSLSETDVEDRLVDAFRQSKGMVLVSFSPQNVDRLVSVYRAALRADRDLVVDLYTSAIARATGRRTIPQPGFPRLRVFLSSVERRRILRHRAFDRVDAVRAQRIYPQELAARQGALVLLFRPSMAGDLERARCLSGASAIWSMWPGYLRQPSSQPLLEFLSRHAIPLTVHHSSGHASVADLQRLARALQPRRLVPIHTFGSEHFADHFANVERHPDGTWWDV
jgi:ribonuclease J